MSLKLLQPSRNQLLKNIPQSLLRLQDCGKSSQSKKSSNKVNNKIALVTGASQGIGFAMCRLLLACGAKGVLIADINEKNGKYAICKLCEEFGDDKAVFIKTDVTKQKHLERAYQCVKEYFGGLDIVVNNAGIMRDDKPDETIEINCKGVLRSTLLAFRHMGKHEGNKGGVVVNTASRVAFIDFHGAPVYAASKYFVIGITKNMGHPYFYDKTGVKVMAVCPGVTNTDMVVDQTKNDLPGFKGTGNITDRRLKEQPKQPAEAVGCCLIHALGKDKNGSIYLSEDGECIKHEIPDRHSMRVNDE